MAEVVSVALAKMMLDFESAERANLNARKEELKQLSNQIKNVQLKETQNDVAEDVYQVTATDLQDSTKTESIDGDPVFTEAELTKINTVKATLTELRNAVANATDKTIAQKALDEYRATNVDFLQVVKWHNNAVNGIQDLDASNSKQDWMINDETIDKYDKQTSNHTSKKIRLKDRRNLTEFTKERIGLTSLNTETGEFINLDEKVKEGMKKLGIKFEEFKGRLIILEINETDKKKMLTNIGMMSKMEEAQISMTEDGTIIFEDDKSIEKYFNRKGDIVKSSSSSQTRVLIPKTQAVASD